MNKLHWNGKWIWAQDRPVSETNIYVHFRKTFEINSVPDEAIANISADSRYMLWINGRFVCRGVPMCDPLYQYYDEADIAAYLLPGKNVIAVLVHHYGVANSTYQFSGMAGLLFEAKIGETVIASNGDWKLHVDEAYIRNVPRICATHALQGFQEQFDARRYVAEWQEIGFDDSDWQPPRIIEFNKIDTPPIDPWPSLVPRDIPHYFEEEWPAHSIYRIGEVTNAPLGEDNDLSAKMHAEPMQELEYGFIENPEAMLGWDDAYTTVSQDPDNPDACPSVIIDFGREVTGMPKIEVEGPAGAIVDIALAELSTSQGINHYWGDLIGMGVAHRYILREGKQTFETFGRFGFRYAQLTFRNLSAPIKIRRVSLNFGSYDVGDRGRFESDDAFLNELWKTGAYTAQCCMYDGWEDCPGREQRQWVGDARVEALIAYACFGDLALTRKFLIQTGQSQRADGMTMMFYPGCGGIANATIVDYNLHWIAAIEDYYTYSGDSELVKELYPKVILSLGWWEKRVNADGLLDNVPSHLYLDLCLHGPGPKGIITVLNCFYLGALRSAAKIAEMNGDINRMREWLNKADKLADAINSHLFDESKGVYADQLLNGKLSETANQQSNILPMFYDIVPGERQASVWEHITNEEQLRRTREDAEQGKQIVAAQPFFMYFLFELFAKRGRYDLIVEQSRRLWKPMIESGHGTLWETWFDERENVEKGTQSSMCHAWAGTPTYHLSSDILGVRPTSPAFATFDIRPHPVDLKQVKGVYPSVIGDIEVAWEAGDDRFNIEFSVPKYSIARVVLPFAGAKKVTIDGRETSAYSLYNNGLEFTSIGPGRHTITAEI